MRYCRMRAWFGAEEPDELAEEEALDMAGESPAFVGAADAT